MAGDKRARRVSLRLQEEPSVRELLSVMAANNSPGQWDMAVMLQQIAGLEKQLNAAVTELAAMRRELSEARESPVKRTLDKTVKTLEKNVATLRERLDGLKQAVVDGCKKALAAFREQGVSALAHTAEFFHIRPALETVGRELDKAIAQGEKALSVVDTASREYHEAGLHLKNVLRAVTGRVPVAEPKGPGALARALSAPLKAERGLLSSMKGRTLGALDSLGRLEQAAEHPPIRKTMEELNAKIAKERQGQDKPAPAVRREER